MTDVIAAEFLKIRTVRSTYVLLAAIVGLMVTGLIVDFAMVADWDGSTAAEQARFASADARVMVIPFAQFILATLGALAVTTEFGTGMIRPSLVAVPSRLAMVAAKVAVVGGVALVAGEVAAFGTFLLSWSVAGDYPAPLWTWSSLSDALGSVLWSGLSVAVCGLVGLGIGLVVRSTAGALVTMGGLLFVLPSLAFFLPEPWDLRAAAVMLPNLAWQLDGTSEIAILSPLGALVAMSAYVLVAVGAGTLALLRRDA